LVTIGLVTWDELEPVIMREYRTGLVDFHTGPYSSIAHNSLWLPDVLSLAIDANGLLALMRRKLEAAGSTILDHRLFSRVLVPATGTTHVTVELTPVGNQLGNQLGNQQDGQREQYTAQLLMDGMGTTSPLGLVRHRGTPFAGICPTVGTAVRGFAQGSGPREVDPTIGDILISVADTQGNRQFIWEGFPGREDEMAVYVFYYAALGGKQHYRPDEQPPISLLELFENYFSLLPTYKQPGPTFAHLKPLYGYIPGRHSLSPQEAPLLRGVVPIGDAAAQQSPLTYCGFGSHVRNLHRTTSLLDYALRQGLLEPEHLGHINAFQTNVSLNWVFSHFMQPWGRPHNVNELQNVFLRALNELGTPLSARFFQDQMRWSDYNSVIWTVLMNYPIIIAKAWRVLGMAGIYQWARDYTRFTMETFLAAIARTSGHGVERASLRLFDRIAPALSLRIRGKYAEWRAMRWITPTSSPRAEERLAQSAPSRPRRTS
jgi:lycopene cyclase CruA